MADRAVTLEAWTVATFDVVVFGLGLVVAGHESGALVDALPDVGTVAGVLVFGYLWALVLAAMRWVLADGGLARSEGDLLSLLVRGGAGGALVGLAFVGGLGLAVGLVSIPNGIEPLSVALLTLFGSVAGAVGGAVVGLVFGVVDVALYRSVDLLSGRPPE